MGPHCRCMGSTCILLSALLGPCGPMRGPCEARLTRARCGPTERRGPAARTPRMGPACRCMGSACHVAHTLRVGAARPMRAHARPMRLAADAGPPPTNGRCLPSRPDASHGARMPLHGEHMPATLSCHPIAQPERVPMQCTAAGCSSCELPSSRSCVTRPLVSPTPWEGGSRGASAATSAAAASSAVEVVPIDGRKQLLPPLGRRDFCCPAKLGPLQVSFSDGH
jgi:hypothetical protein